MGKWSAWPLWAEYRNQRIKVLAWNTWKTQTDFGEINTSEITNFWILNQSSKHICPGGDYSTKLQFVIRYQPQHLLYPGVDLKIKKRYRSLLNTGRLRQGIVAYKKFESISEVAAKQQKALKEKRIEGIARNRADIFKILPHCEEHHLQRERVCKLTDREIWRAKQASKEKRERAVREKLEDANVVRAQCGRPEIRIKEKVTKEIERRVGLEDLYKKIWDDPKISIAMVEYRYHKERMEFAERSIATALGDPLPVETFEHLVDWGLQHFRDYWTTMIAFRQEYVEKVCKIFKTTYLSILAMYKSLNPKFNYLKQFCNKVELFERYMPFKYAELRGARPTNGLD